ncbi:hypothetical protein PanWU01x14_014670 [Parasponia andersonii]|uniref:Uncharacterized protein n=1 Tax=Parasponia andersonii TaxID=3476 RepID=A0A2P5E0E1_PARAD|nr:hypothetical protein PanWU01x14_014670 [Parasponia andersonii]
MELEEVLTEHSQGCKSVIVEDLMSAND